MMVPARVIHTEHVYPPIPPRQYDWRAIFDGYDPGDPMGYGATEEAAIADLILTSDYEGSISIVRGIA